MFAIFFAAAFSFEEFGSDKAAISVGYYTMIKLQNEKSKMYLSSVPFNYINGSHQQITYAIKNSVLAETYWTVYPLPNETNIEQGENIQCGSTIRLNHASTGKYLHSHAIDGTFGHGYEVSAFDEDDTGNFWVVECDGDWLASTSVKLMHQDTKMYLAVNETCIYSKEINGREVFADDVPEGNEWVVQGGIFVTEDD